MFLERQRPEEISLGLFSVFPKVWHHGDYVEITEHGGVQDLRPIGRHLNPSGVRIGTAEIYRQVESLDEIADSIVVGQGRENDSECCCL